LAIAFVAGLGVVPAAAEPAALEGSWSGFGHVVFPSGEKEKARCRATFRRMGGSSYGMSAICATASARVQQTATLSRVLSNRYRGEFTNAEFGVSGSIRIEVKGSRLDASLSGGGGSAQFALRR
jgi:hypothetical protein